MKRSWSSTLAVSAVVAASSMAQVSARPLILLDHSGSMKGFHSSGAADIIVSKLRGSLRDEPRVVWVMSSRAEVTLVEEWNPPERFGGQTRLYESLSQALHRYPDVSSLWLLTDNVPSHEQSDRDLNEFYDWLRGDGPPAVTLFVLKLPFAGTLYGADGRSHLDSHYSGLRALVLYAALLDPDAGEEFRGALDSVDSALNPSSQREALKLRCKPLQYESVEMEIVEVPGGGMTRAADGTIEGKGKEGQGFQGTFGIRLRTMLDHVQFLNARPSFEASEVFRTEDFDTPELGSLLAEKSIEEIGEGWSGFDVTLTLEPARLRRTWSSAWKAFFKGDEPGRLEGTVTLELEVDRKSVVIFPEDVEAFSTGRSVFEDPSQEVQSKVYRLQELFQEKFVESHLQLVPTMRQNGNETVRDGKVPVRILVDYSPLNALIILAYVLLPILVPLSLLSMLWWSLSGRYRLEGGGVSEKPFRIRPRYAVRGEGGLLGTFYQLPPWIWFSAGPGWRLGARTAAGGKRKGTRSQRLFREGGKITLTPRSGGDDARLVLSRIRFRGHASGAPEDRDSSPRRPSTFARKVSPFK